MKKLLFFLLCSIVMLHGAGASADGMPDLSRFRDLFGDSGLLSLRPEDFSFDSIDFDLLLRFAARNTAINYSELNYDALLEVLTDPANPAGLGIEAIDEDALLDWLKDPATEKRLDEMMLTVRDGGSFTESVRALREDPDFSDAFSKITRGQDIQTVAGALSSGNAPGLFGRMAAALLSPRSGPPSETARAISALVQSASDTLGWK